MKSIKLFVSMLFCFFLLSSAAFALDIQILPENATEDDDLECTIVGMGEDDSELFDYYWYVNREFAAVSRELDNSNTDAGDNVMCYVTDSFGFFVGSNTITILPAPEEEPENRRPSVEITSPTENVFYVDQTVLFSASGSDPDGDSLDYSWDFGDGSDADFQIVVHRYSRSGSFVATARVSDGELTASESVTLEIRERPEEKELNQRPVAVIGVSDRFVGPGDTVFLNGLMSYDPDGRIVSYEWTLRPDAEYANTEFVFGDSDDPIIGLRLNRNGFHRVDLRVTDDNGATDAEFVLILVSGVFAENENPVADMSADNEDVFAGDTVNFDASESYDPDGEIVSYSWDFGDGTRGDGINPSHIYNIPGGYEATLMVIDDDGATDTDTLIITVFEPVVEPNQNPVADISADTLNGFVGFPLNFDASGSYDPDGTIVSYSWDFGDGATSNLAVVSHTYINSGTYAVILRVTDDDGATDEETVEVNAGLIDRGPDIEKRPAILRADDSDFSFGRIIPSVGKLSYSNGENIVLFVKIANEASRDAQLDFVLSVPEFNYQYNINNVNVDSGQTKFITAFVNIPENAAAGNYIARLSLDSGEDIRRDYWQFIVA